MKTGTLSARLTRAASLGVDAAARDIGERGAQRGHVRRDRLVAHRIEVLLDLGAAHLAVRRHRLRALLAPLGLRLREVVIDPQPPEGDGRDLGADGGPLPTLLVDGASLAEREDVDARVTPAADRARR